MILNKTIHSFTHVTKKKYYKRCKLYLLYAKLCKTILDHPLRFYCILSINLET